MIDRILNSVFDSASSVLHRFAFEEREIGISQ